MRTLSQDNKFQLDALDGLRGLAVLIVFLSHTSNEGMSLIPFVDCSGIGKSGVFLFFILSAFLLTRPFIKEGVGAINKDFFINYSIRRFVRIYPLYFLYLLLGLITSLLASKILKLDRPVGVPFVLSVTDFYEHLLLIQGKGVTWSIVVEFHYYLVIPVLALTYSILLKRNIFSAIILTIILIVWSQVIWPPSESTSNDPRLGPYLPILFIGSLLAVIFHQWQEKKMSNNKCFVVIVDALGVLAIALLIFTIPSVSGFVLRQEIALDYYHRQFILFGILWSVVVFSCVTGSGLLSKFFEIQPLRYLGHISFSMYLLHVIVLKLIQKSGLDFPGQGWVVLALTISFSHITFTLIEKPLSKIKWPL